MTKPGSARAPKGAVGGTCRRNRRRSPSARRPGWVRPYRRAQRAIDSAASVIFSTFDTVEGAGRCVERHPLRTARRLTSAVRRMTAASLRLIDARRELAAANEALGRAPESQNGDAPELMELAAERCQAVATYIPIAVHEVLSAQLDVLAGLATGELVPERASGSRPRIVLTPRPLFVRAFLTVRKPRVADRIQPILLRRRRTPPPAEVRVPRRSLRGRAPPLSSTSPL